MQQVITRYFAQLTGDVDSRVDLLGGQSIRVRDDPGNPSKIEEDQVLRAADFLLRFAKDSDFPSPGQDNLQVPVVVQLEMRERDPEPITLQGKLLVRRDDVGNCSILGVELEAELGPRVWQGLTLHASRAQLKLGSAPWKLTLEPQTDGQPVAELSVFGVKLESGRLAIDAGGVVEGAFTARLQQPVENKKLKAIRLLEAQASLKGPQCQVRLRLAFELDYFVGAKGELDVLASRTSSGAEWQVAASTQVNSDLSWSDPSGWLSFERMGLGIDLVSKAGELQIGDLRTSGTVTFRPGALVGAAKDWLGKLFSGLSAEFRDVKLLGDSLKTFRFGFEPLGGLRIGVLDIFQMHVPVLSFGHDALELLDLGLETDFGGAALRGRLGKLRLSLNGMPSLDLGGSLIELAMSAPNGIKASGQLQYLETGLLNALEGRGQLSTPTFPGVEIMFRVGKYRENESAGWSPTLLVYAATPVVIPLFPGVIVRELGIGVGINCAIKGTSASTLAQARKTVEEGLPDISKPEYWIPGKTAVTLAARAIATATKAPSTKTPELYVADLALILTSDFHFTVLGKLWLQTSLEDAKTTRFQAKPAAIGMMLLDGQEPSLRVVAQTRSDGLNSIGVGGLVGRLLGAQLPETRLAFEATSSGMAMVIGPNPVGGELGPLRVTGSSLLAFRSSPSHAYAILRASLAAGFAASSGVSLGLIEFRASLRFGFSSELVLLGSYRDNNLLVYGKSHVAAYVELSLHLRIGFRIRIGLPFGRSITISWALDYDFNLQVHVDLQLEVALNTDGGIGVRGHAAVSVHVMGIGATLQVPVDQGGRYVDGGRARQAEIENDLTKLLGTA